MRYPIYPARSNPSVDRFILRKKLAYIHSLIENRAADWIDPKNQALGVLLRGRFLPERDHEQIAAGSGFDSAWAKLQSGYAGPLVMQLKTSRDQVGA